LRAMRAPTAKKTKAKLEVKPAAMPSDSGADVSDASLSSPDSVAEPVGVRVALRVAVMLDTPVVVVITDIEVVVEFTTSTVEVETAEEAAEEAAEEGAAEEGAAPPISSN
jgi:hypothetical protein